MTTPFKAIGVLALSSLAIACSSQPDDSLSAFAAQCKASVAPITGETSIQGLTFMGTSIADAPFDTSAAEIVQYDACTDKLYVINAQAKRVDVLSMDDNGAPSKLHSSISAAQAKRQALKLARQTALQSLMV